MTIRIEKLNAETEKDYAKFLLDVPDSLLYHSLSYKNFLKQILTDARDQYLLAYENEKLVGALPVFIKYGALGTVVNSLPFYGSNGSFILKNDCAKL